MKTNTTDKVQSQRLIIHLIEDDGDKRTLCDKSVFEIGISGYRTAEGVMTQLDRAITKEDVDTCVTCEAEEERRFNAR